jgi:hypothetical protein
MTMRYPLAAAAGAGALAACATVPADGDRPAQDTCRAEPGQAFIGQRASAETGGAIMAATRSTRIRWVPPRTAVTMEYAFGRVTVSYDDDSRITALSCS